MTQGKQWISPICVRLLFGLACLHAPLIDADVVTHTSTCSLDHIGYVDSGVVALLGYFTHTEVASTPNITLPQFNPDLGRLNSATLVVAGTTNTLSIHSTGLLSLISGASLTRDLAYNVTAGASNGGNTSRVVTSGSTLLTLLGIGGGEIGGAPAPANLQLSSAADRANLTGTGTVAVRLTATNKFEIFTVLSLFNGAGIVGSGRYTGSIAISYDYTPWALTGRVYNDFDHDSFRGTSEAGTGLPLFAKLLIDSAPAGPATRVAVVDPSSGLYQLAAPHGTHRVVIDDNAGTTDVTPLVAPAGWTGTQASSFSRTVVVLADTADQDFGLIRATRACDLSRQQW